MLVTETKLRDIIRKTIILYESLTIRNAAGVNAENVVRKFVELPEVIRHASSYAPADVQDDKFGFGNIEVKSIQKSEIHIEITSDFPEVKASNPSDLRNKIFAAIDGNPSLVATEKLESYYQRFDNLIGVKRGKIYLVPIDALSLLPSIVYRFGKKEKNPNELRSAFGFKVSIPDCVFLGTVGDAAKRINQKMPTVSIPDKWILPGDPDVDVGDVVNRTSGEIQKDLIFFLQENKIPRNKITWKFLAKKWDERKTLHILEDLVRRELTSLNEIAIKGIDKRGYGMPEKWQLSEDQIEGIIKRSLEEYVVPQYIEDAYREDTIAPM